MDIILEKIGIINNILFKKAPATRNYGLLNGKMGISIYLFHLSRETNNNRHTEFAKKLLDEVYEAVKQRRQTTTTFENGLAGVAWGLDHLVRNNFIEQNEADEIITYADDKLINYLATTETIPIGILNGSIGYVIYILSRLEEKGIPINEADKLIFERLLIKLINDIGTQVEENKIRIQEPYLFDISWDLPLCLIVLGKVRSTQIYNSKIDRILDALSNVVLTLIPCLSSNRLYLLLGIERILREVNLPEWRKHASLLKRNINFDHILKSELRNKSIHFSHGIAGLDLISRQLYQITQDSKFLFQTDDLVEMISDSSYWDNLEQNGLERKSIGLLFYGLSGIGLELVEILKKEPVK